MVTAAVTTSNDGSNGDNGGIDNDETTTPMSTALKKGGTKLTWQASEATNAETIDF